MTKNLDKYLKNGIEESAKRVTEKIRAKSNAVVKDTGKYASSWTYTMEKGGITAKVHNKERYMLTHLLEYGHVQVVGGKKGKGGREVGFVKGKPHIGPVVLEEAAETGKAVERAVEDYLASITDLNDL